MQSFSLEMHKELLYSIISEFFYSAQCYQILPTTCQYTFLFASWLNNSNIKYNAGRSVSVNAGLSLSQKLETASSFWAKGKFNWGVLSFIAPPALDLPTDTTVLSAVFKYQASKAQKTNVGDRHTQHGEKRQKGTFSTEGAGGRCSKGMWW